MVYVLGKEPNADKEVVEKIVHRVGIEKQSNSVECGGGQVHKKPTPCQNKNDSHNRDQDPNAQASSMCETISPSPRAPPDLSVTSNVSEAVT